MKHNMFRAVIVLALIYTCQVLVAGDRQKRETKTCNSCKVAFIAERTNSVSVAERCRTLKNYVSCLTYTTKLSTGCPLSNVDTNNIYDYRNAMPYQSCYAYDTCQCQIERWTDASSNDQMKYMKYLGCLYDSVQAGCDGSTTASIISTAQLERSNYITPRNECDSTFQNYNSWNPTYNCESFERYMKCLGYSATDSQGIPFNQTLQSSLDAIDGCEISMTDTCTCQTQFIMPANSSDTCRVVKDYVSCLDKSFMRGCDRQNLDDVKKTAQILQRQYCSNDPINDCNGTASCYIDSSRISSDNETVEIYSCSSMKTYMECVKSHAPTCQAAVSTATALNSTFKNWNCPYILSQASTTPYPTSSYYYPTSSYYYPTSSYYYPTSSYYYPTSSSQSGSYGPSTTPYPGSGHGSKAVDTTLLSAYILSAKMEAEETLHAAQETVDAITAAQKLIQGA
ncbi:uncharacterized protein [Haliotis cracherodii]|uniref:uncharacterized protein n=1 Tax=Haliotis cracherodii TaxID=6455 RepID=UPI0039E7A2BF